MDNSYLIGLIAWFFPGAGHIKQGYWQRGIIIGSVIWLMFIIGIIGGGAFYPGYSFKDGSLLYLLHIFALFGNGLGDLINFFISGSPPSNVASWASFEYGGRFVEIAGLLNYLAIIDAIDISTGRKK